MSANKRAKPHTGDDHQTPQKKPASTFQQTPKYETKTCLVLNVSSITKHPQTMFWKFPGTSSTWSADKMDIASQWEGILPAFAPQRQAYSAYIVRVRFAVNSAAKEKMVDDRVIGTIIYVGGVVQTLKWNVVVQVSDTVGYPVD